MSTSSKVKISKINRDLQLLRSFVIGMSGKDNEGRYRPEFVKHILNSLSEKPHYEFKDKVSFLKELKKSSA